MIPADFRVGIHNTARWTARKGIAGFLSRGYAIVAGPGDGRSRSVLDAEVSLFVRKKGGDGVRGVTMEVVEWVWGNKKQGPLHGNDILSLSRNPQVLPSEVSAAYARNE